MKVISVYNNFGNTGGAQDMALHLAAHFSPGETPVMLTATAPADVTPAYRTKARYITLTLKNVKKILREWPDAVFLSHDRKSTTRLMLYRAACRRPIKIVHVAHNVFTNLRFLTLFPKHVVAISRAVASNLLDYFKIPEKNITLIPNGLPDRGVRPVRQGPGIKILLMGRICSVKRQLEIVRAIDARLPAGTTLHIAGRGPQEQELTALLTTAKNTFYEGQIDPSAQIAGYDYVLLFSEKEGLPLSLIEACMYGRPMITNTLPSVLQINRPGITGYACDSFDALRQLVQELPSPGSAEYLDMARAARLRYETHFTERTMLDAYEAILKLQ